jgi:hypothetical protein
VGREKGTAVPPKIRVDEREAELESIQLTPSLELRLVGETHGVLRDTRSGAVLPAVDIEASRPARQDERDGLSTGRRRESRFAVAGVDAKVRSQLIA